MAAAHEAPRGCLIFHDLVLPPELQALLLRFCEEYGDDPLDVIADALEGHFDALAGATFKPDFLSSPTPPPHDIASPTQTGPGGGRL